MSTDLPLTKSMNLEKYMRVRFLLTFFVCSMVNPVYLANAIESSYVFEHPIYYSPLANHVGVDGDIVAITEDKQGFIWFVSDNGLWRWDSHMAVRAIFALRSIASRRVSTRQCLGSID